MNENFEIHIIFQVTMYAPTKLRLNNLYITIYILWLKMIAIEIVPYVIIIVLNILMVVE